MKKIGKAVWARQHYRAGRIARDLALERKAAIERFGEVAAGIFHCSSCGAPVLNSGLGRLNHAQRLPKCRTAVGL